MKMLWRLKHMMRQVFVNRFGECMYCFSVSEWKLMHATRFLLELFQFLSSKSRVIDFKKFITWRVLSAQARQHLDFVSEALLYLLWLRLPV